MNRRALSLRMTRQVLGRLTLVLSLLMIWAVGAGKQGHAAGLSSLPADTISLAKATDQAAVAVKTTAVARATEDRSATGPDPFLLQRLCAPDQTADTTTPVRADAQATVPGRAYAPQAPRAPPAA